MFFNYIKRVFIRKNIGLYIFSFALLLGQNNPNYSLSFDGADDYVGLPSYDQNLSYDNGQFSIAVWVKIPSVHNSWWSSIVGGWEGYGYLFYAGNNANDGRILFEVRNGGSVPGVTDIRDDQWHHVCVTYDRSQVIVYLDGEVEAAQDISTNFQSSPGHVLKFGYVNHNVGANEYFPGKMDELSIWNETLS